MDESSKEETCRECSSVSTRVYTPAQFIGTAVQSAEYNPGLGCVVKSDKDRAEIARRKGLQEIGNDFGSGDKAMAKYDKDRTERLNKRWDDI